MRCVTQFAIVTDLENELVQQNEDVIADQQVRWICLMCYTENIHCFLLNTVKRSCLHALLFISTLFDCHIWYNNPYFIFFYYVFTSHVKTSTSHKI